MLVPFTQLPPDARVWVFAAARALSADEQRHVLGAVDAFLHDWTAHGEPLAASRDLRYDQFLFVAVDESAAGASGCSIDAMVRVLTALEARIAVPLTNHGPVLFRDASGVRRVERPEFARLAREGAVTSDTVVFDNTLTRLSDLQAGRWEIPARDSWHQRAFFSSPAAARA